MHGSPATAGTSSASSFASRGAVPAVPAAPTTVPPSSALRYTVLCHLRYLSGEDPFLGFTLVQPVIKGIQANNVVANAKHYAENNVSGLQCPELCPARREGGGETERHTHSDTRKKEIERQRKKEVERDRDRPRRRKREKIERETDRQKGKRQPDKQTDRASA